MEKTKKQLEEEVLQISQDLKIASKERDRVNNLEKELATFHSDLEKAKQDLKTALKERDQRIQDFLDIQKETDALKKEIALRNEQLETLSSKFNDLAKLFDEHLKGFDDIMEIQKLFLRNNVRTQELLQVKIKAFNGEGDKK